MSTYQAEYTGGGYFHIFDANDDYDALHEAEEMAEDDDELFELFEIHPETYEQIRSIF